MKVEESKGAAPLTYISLIVPQLLLLVPVPESGSFGWVQSGLWSDPISTIVTQSRTKTSSFVLLRLFYEGGKSELTNYNISRKISMCCKMGLKKDRFGKCIKEFPRLFLSVYKTQIELTNTSKTSSFLM